MNLRLWRFKMIKKCENCIPHKYQDEKYGKNMRVFTENKEKGKSWCTICGKEKTTEAKK